MFLTQTPKWALINPPTNGLEDVLSAMSASDVRQTGDDHPPSTDRLESWKEIATYLDKSVPTVQRWERRAALPVYRHATELARATQQLYYPEFLPDGRRPAGLPWSAAGNRGVLSESFGTIR